MSHEAWLGWLVIIGSLPVAVVGLIFKKQIEGTFTKNLWVIATMMVVIALLLAIAEAVGKRQREMKDLGVKDALVVGFAQCLALIPGSSRSGSTIMGGLFAGETRDTAARFSFLLSIPAIAASGLLEMKEALHRLAEGSLAPMAIWDDCFRNRRLSLDMVSAAFSAHAYNGRVHRLPDYCRRDNSGVASMAESLRCEIWSAPAERSGDGALRVRTASGSDRIAQATVKSEACKLRILSVSSIRSLPLDGMKRASPAVSC